MNEEIKYTIHEHIGTVYCKPNGWRMELNIVSWADDGAKLYDLRRWNSNHTKYSRGARFSESDLKPLMEIIKKRLEEIEHE